MSVAAERHGAGFRRVMVPGTFGAQPVATGKAMLGMWRQDGEIRRRVDGPVEAEEERRDRMHLEVKVCRESAGVSGVAHEADHLARAGRARRSRPRSRTPRGARRGTGCPGGRGARGGSRGRVVPADGVEGAGQRPRRAVARARRRCRLRAGRCFPPFASRSCRRRRRPVDREDVRGCRERAVRPAGGRRSSGPGGGGRSRGSVAGATARRQRRPTRRRRPDEAAA